MPAKTAEPVEPKPARGPTPFVRVDHPSIWPQACAICQSAKGPLVDTLKEPTTGRLYVCSQCVKWLGLELGLIDGERMDELLAADAALAVAKQEIADREQEITTMRADAAARSQKIEALNMLVQQSYDADRQRRHLLEQQHEISKQLLQGVS